MRKLQQAPSDLPRVLEKTTNQGELHEKDLKQITGGGNSVRFDPYKTFRFHVQ
jgi:bacteriocin-like protein